MTIWLRRCSFLKFKEKKTIKKFFWNQRNFLLGVIARVEKIHGSLLSDLAEAWQCPDWLVWKFWSRSDQALISIPWKKRLYVANENFFERLGFLIEIHKRLIKMVFQPKLY